MVFELQILNSDAELNKFFDIKTASFVPGVPLTLCFRIAQPERDGLRYVPEAGTTFSMNFMTSDDTVTITKVPTQLDASDRSLITVELDATETQNLISQNLRLDISEPTAGNSVAFKQMALRVLRTDEC